MTTSEIDQLEVASGMRLSPRTRSVLAKSSLPSAEALLAVPAQEFCHWPGVGAATAQELSRVQEALQSTLTPGVTPALTFDTRATIKLVSPRTRNLLRSLGVHEDQQLLQLSLSTAIETSRMGRVALCEIVRARSSLLGKIDLSPTLLPEDPKLITILLNALPKRARWEVERRDIRSISAFIGWDPSAALSDPSCGEATAIRIVFAHDRVLLTWLTRRHHFALTIGELYEKLTGKSQRRRFGHILQQQFLPEQPLRSLERLFSPLPGGDVVYQVLCRRTGLTFQKPETQLQIAADVSVSRARIGQIEERAVRWMRSNEPYFYPLIDQLLRLTQNQSGPISSCEVARIVFSSDAKDASAVNAGRFIELLSKLDCWTQLGFSLEGHLISRRDPPDRAIP